MITPIGFILVGVIGEGRLVPLDGARQFKSFFPGDIFLGVATAFMVFAAGFVPASDRWFTSTLFHVAAITVTFIAAVWMTYQEYKGGVYPLAAILSPTKLYHNFVLYTGYGYVAVVTFVAVIFGANWSLGVVLVVAASLAMLGPWIYLVIQDNSLNKRDQSFKAGCAHISEWRFLGVIGPRSFSGLAS